jgi:hypothetical protein
LEKTVKRRIALGTFAMLLAAPFALGRSGAVQSSTSDLSPITGVWRANMDGSPALVMVVTDESGSLAGAVMFYFHVRKTVNDPYTSTPGLPEPMFGIHFDGKILEFEVSHRRAHPPSSLADPPAHFRLTLTDPGKAVFVNENEGHGPAIVLERSDF